jgi:hypothetical protein
MDESKKKKILEAVKRHKKKRKTEGKVEIEGVEDPHVKKPKSKHVEEKHKEHAKPKHVKKPVMLGPHGGQYKVGPSGKKDYKTKDEKAKKSLESFVQSASDLMKSFIKRKKGEQK